MVRVASLSSFPRGCVTRDFYAPVPLADDTDTLFVRKRKRDRIRKRRERDAERQGKMPDEVRALFQKNGGVE